MLSGAAIYFRADLALRFLVTEVKLACALVEYPRAKNALDDGIVDIDDLVDI